MSPYIPQFKSIVMYDTMKQPEVYDVIKETVRSGKAILDSFNDFESLEQGNAALFVQLTLSLGQYRFNGQELHLDPSTALSYPIFDSFDRENRTVVGVLGMTLYWKFYLRNILPETMLDQPGLELFARKLSTGWISWGNEPFKFNCLS